jgi:hypothetical protein
MNTTTNGKKQSAKSINKKEGFTAEEKAAMKARAREMKEKTDGESAVREAIAGMSPQDRAIAKRLPCATSASAASWPPSPTRMATFSGCFRTARA